MNRKSVEYSPSEAFISELFLIIDTLNWAVDYTEAPFTQMNKKQ